ncbi:hypothetical protein BJ994_000992 [Arthrobacter pigmenti]|uniref:HNH nuclease domain-containing protein n=1 Tax=Arthrobacter pigmenti TaxID=271432 RepID=A0A846RS74_9MICC|nr:HNH endonuclease signature motif containing protein [Arthrobacter pigmenti]NJC21916.1 hypothetical protein [Arthrobacter pigmenti]
MDFVGGLPSLEDAYRDADRGWRGAHFEENLDPGGGGFFPDEHARARVEEASPYGLLGFVQGFPDSFGSFDSSGWPGLADALDVLRAADRLISWAAGQRARLVSRVYAASDAGNSSWSGRDLQFTEAVSETAALLKLSEGAASRLVTESLALTGSLPGTLEALEEGRLCPGRASVIVEQSRTLPAEAVPGFEAKVLETAAELNRPKLTARCRRLREKLHPETITVRRVRAETERCVLIEPGPDGMSWLSAYLPAEQAHAIHTTLDATARGLRAADDPRTLPQLRADVFADILLNAPGTVITGGRGGDGSGVGCGVGPTAAVGGSAAGHPNGSTEREGRIVGAAGDGVRVPSTAKILVTVPVFSLMGLTDEPAELEGYGPIPAEAARELAGNATSFLRLLTHPYTGAVLGLDRTRYRPSEDLRTWIQVREKTCTFYGCNRPASRCELDHLISWAGNGTTSQDNLYPVCKRHHMLKHQTDWTPKPHPEGSGGGSSGGLSWTSPGGRTYTTPPETPPAGNEVSPTTRILQNLTTAMRTRGDEDASPDDGPEPEQKEADRPPPF